MKILIQTLIFTVIVLLVKSQTASELGHACIIQMLKSKGVLDSDFPYPRDPRGCELLGLIISSMEDGFYSKFDDAESIKADCVKAELKRNGFMNYAMKKEVVEMSKKLSQDKISELLNENKEDMKRVLNNAAENCDSDPTWAGIFDEILGLKNESHAVLERDYCFLKISLDKNLIDVGDIDRNPKQLDTTTVNCENVMINRKNEITTQLKLKYGQMGLPEYKTNCVIDKLSNSNFFDTTIALETLERLDIDPSVRAKNKNNLSTLLQSGVMKIFSCLM